MTANITPAEIQADREAERAMAAHQAFRAKHWAYFASTERVEPKTGVVLPRVRNEALERESFRLFEIARNANKRALDLEHAAKAVA